MDSHKSTARLAGLFWFLMAATGGFSLVYVRPRLMVASDGAATVKNILAMESLFRASIVSSILSAIFSIFFGLAIYRVFRVAQKRLSQFFLISLLLAAGISAVNAISNLGVLVVLGNGEYMKAFQPDQVTALAMIFLKVNNYGLGVAELFAALYLFSLGLLIYKTGYIPRAIGILLMIGACMFPVNTFSKILDPQFYPVLLTKLTMMLNGPGTVLTMFWLLIKGIDERAGESQAQAASHR